MLRTRPERLRLKLSLRKPLQTIASYFKQALCTCKSSPLSNIVTITALDNIVQGRNKEHKMMVIWLEMHLGGVMAHLY
jgi:hypothetical protein